VAAQSQHHTLSRVANLDAKKAFITRTIPAIAISSENMVMIILPPVIAALASVRRIEEHLDELDRRRKGA